MSTKTIEGKTKLKDILDALRSFWSSDDETSISYTMTSTEAKEVVDLDPNSDTLNQAIKKVESMGNETEEPVNKVEKDKRTMSQARLDDLRSRLTGQAKKSGRPAPEITASKEKEKEIE